ncbi:MAG: tetratricopeptide repeat protein [Anaerolineae bacterium]|nr:tetratricopeptide repeat protein [Anaerolineae bacterium]
MWQRVKIGRRNPVLLLVLGCILTLIIGGLLFVPEYLFQRANESAANDAFEDAIPYLDLYLALVPSSTRAYFNRGTAYLMLNDFESAISDLSKAIEINPDYVAAYQNRGYIYGVLDEHVLALADLDRAVQLDPNNAVVYVIRGNILAQMWKDTEAESDMRRAIEIAPDNYDAYFALSLIYRNRGDYQTALEYAVMCLNLIDDQNTVDKQAAIELVNELEALNGTDS